jgi:hypothetical protein
MKPKNYFKQAQTEQSRETLKKEFSEQFGPLYKNKKTRFIAYVKANPKKSFATMMLLLCLNFILMLYLDTKDTVKKNDPFTNFRDYITNTPLVQPTKGQISPTIGNIMTLREIQDSLLYYSDKNNLKTREDTITLKKLLGRYATVDPTIFKQK